MMTRAEYHAECMKCLLNAALGELPNGELSREIKAFLKMMDAPLQRVAS